MDTVWTRSLVAVIAAAVLAGCSGTGGGSQALTIADKAFLQKLTELGGTASGEGAQHDAISVGRTFCGELESGASQAEAHETVYSKYLGVGLKDIQMAAAAASLTYCPQMR
jgi:hypothetical protein